MSNGFFFGLVILLAMAAATLYHWIFDQETKMAWNYPDGCGPDDYERWCGPDPDEEDEDEDEDDEDEGEVLE